ncbi:urease accessory protein [Lipingzhangella halophila]|uniref:Urease accessory protein UreD n=1 Tax=Lipingzhangella halophila TaxID=1783352 RepID=A0A7W7RE61_9ACTN|nr:urease accessory protein UreD [Lipingzhangella halophila]MBB4930234.1 urease accessory protein [Lipingzhangella halophila]
MAAVTAERPVRGEPVPSVPTVVSVARSGDRTRPVALRTGTFLAPCAMRRPGTAQRVALTGVRASLCAGDEVDLRVDVGPGAELELSDPNGTLAYNARGGRAAWCARVTVAEGGRMTWYEPSFVVSSGADVLREIDVVLAPGAELLWWETLVLGRAGEQGGALRSRTRVEHEGAELLVEDLDLRDVGERELPGIIGPARVLGQVGLFGRVPGLPVGADRLDLAGPGALWRSAARRTYRADAELAPVWQAWGGHG